MKEVFTAEGTLVKMDQATLPGEKIRVFAVAKREKLVDMEIFNKN